ncbi:unnamed protein product [Ascophyllum nodosum]
MGKQGELMEQMAKAKRDRLKKELEDKLRESGDLPPDDDGDTGKKPAVASGGARMKPERSWREAGAAKAAAVPSSAASVSTKKGPPAETGAGGQVSATASKSAATGRGIGRKTLGPGGTAAGSGKVWPSVQPEGRSRDAYELYDDLLEGTGSGDGKESQFSPELENPNASYEEYGAMRTKRSGTPSFQERHLSPTVLPLHQRANTMTSRRC